MRILYGIQSEGLGHVIRSNVLVQQLAKKHKIIVACGGKTYGYMRERYNDVEHVGGFHIVYENNAVNNFATSLSNIASFPKQVWQSKGILRLVHKFRPDVVITDFEPFTAYAALIFGVPLLSIDNQHLQERTNIKHPQDYFLDKFIAKIIVNMMVPSAHHYLTTSLVPLKVTNKHTTVVPPIVRDIFFNTPTSEGKHFVVYQTSARKNNLLQKLRTLPYQFRVYGFHKHERRGNVLLRAFNEDTLVKDLASARGVISGGSFGIISESLTLQKPVFCIPVEKQYEQILSAHVIERKKWGMWADTIDQFSHFVEHLQEYKQNLISYRGIKSGKIVKRVDNVLHKLANRKA